MNAGDLAQHMLDWKNSIFNGNCIAVLIVESRNAYLYDDVSSSSAFKWYITKPMKIKK